MKMVYLIREGNNSYIPTEISGGRIITRYPNISKSHIENLTECINQDNIYNTPIKKLFKINSSKKIKNSLLISYYFAHVENKPNPINIEIDKWDIKNSFFEKCLNEYLSHRRITSIRKLSKHVSAIVNTAGLHILNLRFENIHLTMDLIEQNLVYGIHWDKYAPSFSPRSWINHNLHDVLKI